LLEFLDDPALFHSAQFKQILQITVQQHSRCWLNWTIGPLAIIAVFWSGKD